MSASWRWAPALTLLLLVSALGACGGGEGSTIEVAAASSLRHVLPRIVEDFERANPEVEVELRFSGSQVLAAQLEEGASADLFISANRAQASRLAEAGLASLSTVVTANRLVVAVRDDAPWLDLDGLAAADVRIAVGNPSVPVGALTLVALASLPPAVSSALRGKIVTEDPSVRIVLSRLELGEVDAAFVYGSDVEVTRGLRALPLPLTVPVNEYLAVVLQGAAAPTEDLLAFLLGPDAQAIFQAGGFLSVVAGVQSR